MANKQITMKRLALLITVCFLSLGFLAHAQQVTVKGVVTSAEGEALQGVSVSVKGSSTVTVTGQTGAFSIQASPDATLVFSSVGLESQEIALDGRETLRVVMHLSHTSLEDVVVIGYGSVKKKDLTGSVAVIKSEDLNFNSPLTLEQGLQGKIAGVNVLSNDGAPGGGMSIQIRGSNTFSGSGEPLYVVDGVPINASNSDATPLEGTVADPNSYQKQQTNALAFLSPKDIESIEILKDASAAAIYGSRGANGVVIITTKKGRTGQRPQIEASAETSFSNIRRFTEVMSGREYTQYINDVTYWTNYWNLYDPATGTSSYVPVDRDYPYPGIFDFDEGTYKKGPLDFNEDRNIWQRAIIQTAQNQLYTVSMSGGTEMTTYSVRFNHANQDGIIQNSGFQRNGLNVNLNQKTTDWLSLGLNGNFSLMNYNLVNTANTNDFGTMGLIKTAIYARPVDAEVPRSFLDEGGFYATSSPLAYIASPDYNNQISVFGNLYADITFLPTLKLRSNVGYQLGQFQRHKYYNRNLYEGRSAQEGDGYATAGFNKNFSMSFENTLTFDKLYDKHHVNAMGTVSMNQFGWNNYSMGVRGFGLDVTQGYDMSAAVGIPNVWSTRGESSLMSFLGRVSYDYDSRYYLTGSVRYDGASNFAANNKWAPFYSFAVAYNVANEPFLRDVSGLDLLKLRYSLGFTGNQGIGAYASLAHYVHANYPFEGVVENGYILSSTSPGNANLRWETTRQHNLGLDLSLFNSRINFTVDAYHKYTYDLLQFKSVAMSTGVIQQPMNVGAVMNRGLELSVSGAVISKPDFTWNVSANWSANRNKILRFGDNADAQSVYGPYRLEGLLLKEGYPIGQLYGYVEDGYWDSIDEFKGSSIYKRIQETTPDELPSDRVIAQNYLGEIKYKDINNDGLINEYDRTMIGDVNPDYIYGITNRFDYKNFSLNVFFQGVVGNDILNAILLNFNSTSTWANRPPGLLDHAWTPERAQDNPDQIRYPRLGENLSRNVRFSRRYVEDGTYLRLKNVSLSYHIDRFFGIEAIKRVTLTASVNNPLTFTKYSGFDPEVNSAGMGNAAWRGIDVGAYPSSRTAIFNVQVLF